MRYILIGLILIVLCFFAFVVVIGLSASGATLAQYKKKTAIKDVQMNENKIIETIQYFSQNIPQNREVSIGYYIRNKIIDPNMIGYYVKEKDSVLDKGFSYAAEDIENGLTIEDEIELPMTGFKNLGEILHKMKENNIAEITNTNPISFEYGMKKGGTNGFKMFYSTVKLDTSYIQIGKSIGIRRESH